MEANNMSAIHEALAKIGRELNAYCNGHTLLDRMTEDPPDYTCLRDSLLEIERIVATALSDPPRQCDIGTAEEQTARYKKFCSAHKYLGSDFSYMCKGFGKGRCPLFNSHTKSQCEFAWSQMPYEVQEGDTE